MNGDALRYDVKVDLTNKNTAHTQLVRLTGLNKKVLEVGPATGYITQVLRSRGCQVVAIEKDPEAADRAAKFSDQTIVGDVEKICFSETFGDKRFDVIMFGDVLEHLVDPEAVLINVRPLLRPGGSVVASIPNVAHAHVRLMLLKGEFIYTEKGLLDRTHLRFFTREGVAALFERAGYQIRVWRRVVSDGVADPWAVEAPLPEADFPPHLLAALREDPEALTLQFVIKAYPRPSRGSDHHAQRTSIASPDRQFPTLRALWQLEEFLSHEGLERKTSRIIQLEQEARSLQHQLAVRNKALTNLNQRLMDAEMEAASANALREELERIRFTIAWRIFNKSRGLRRSLLPDNTSRGRLWRTFLKFITRLAELFWRPLRRLGQGQ